MAERGEYRSISRSLLSGKDFRALPERARWVFVAVKLNFGFVGIETWYPDELASRLSSETGATADQVKLALDVLEHEGWVRRQDNLVWVVGQLTHDPHVRASDAKHRKNAQRHVAGLPHLELVRAFMDAHPDWFPPSERLAMGLEWVPQESPKTLARVSVESEGGLRSTKTNTSTKTKTRTKTIIPDSSESDLPADVCGRLWDAWQATGRSCEYPLFRKRLNALYPKSGPRYSESALMAAIEAFDELAGYEPPAKRGFWTIHKFVQDIGTFVEWGKMPAVEDGVPTERGAMAIRSGFAS